jgi:carboxypeptidase D
VYSIPDALSPEAPQDASVFLNGGLLIHFIPLQADNNGIPPSDNRTRTALHAPLFEWVESINYPFMTAQREWKSFTCALAHSD